MSISLFILNNIVKHRLHVWWQEDGSWLKPPPSYAAISSPGSQSEHNLEEFISMDTVDSESERGPVLSLTEFVKKFHLNTWAPHQTLVIIQQWYFIKPSVCVAVWRWTDLLQSSSYLNSYHWPSPPPDQAKGSFLSSFYFDQFQMTKNKIILKHTLIIILTLLSTSMFKLYYYCASFVIFYNFWV